jgi:hypothetical protein
MGWKMMIESKLYPETKTLKIVFNNVESVMDFPLVEMFGQKFMDAVEWVQIPTCEAFGKDVLKRIKSLKKTEALVYACDSLDALTSEAGAERMTQILDDKKPSSGYGMEKAKFFSTDFFTHLCSAMEDKDVTLLLVSQVRENIGVSFGEKYHRVGGKSLDFYTHMVVWLSTYEKMKKTFKGQERVFGVKVRANCKRNKTAKPFRQADFQILFDFGIDDVSSMLDFMFGPKCKEYEWKGEKYKKESIIKLFEEDESELLELQQTVESLWKEVEEATAPIRKKRWSK